jgi:hypothetical protein
MGLYDYPFVDTYLHNPIIGSVLVGSQGAGWRNPQNIKASALCLTLCCPFAYGFR